MSSATNKAVVDQWSCDMGLGETLMYWSLLCGQLTRFLALRDNLGLAMKTVKTIYE
jgi:hypothetical protein